MGPRVEQPLVSADQSDCGSWGFLHRQTNSLRRGKPMTLPSKRRKRKARRRDEHDGAWGLPGGAGWMAAPCRRHHCVWVKNPQLCSWDRNAKLKHFPFVNTLPNVPFPGLPRLPSTDATGCPGLGCRIGVTRTVVFMLVPPLPPGVVSEEEEAKESSGLLQVPLGLFLLHLHSPGRRSQAPMAEQELSRAPSMAGHCGVVWRLGTKSGVLAERSLQQREPVLCPAQSCPPTSAW